MLYSNVLTLALTILFSAEKITCEEYLLEEFQNEVLKFEQIKKQIMDENLDEDPLLWSKMFDAWTKIPSGILVGNIYDLGNFDECYDLEFTNFYGQYCLGTLPPSALTAAKFFETNNTMKVLVNHPVVRALTANPNDYGLHFAICIPSNMKASDLPLGLLHFNDDFCYSKATKPKLSDGAIVMIAVYSFFLAIIVASTTYDIVLDYYDKKPLHELLIAFSFLTNGRKIFTSSKNPDQLLCLNGIKAISMMWVILGHEYASVITAPMTNYFEIAEWTADTANMLINGASVSVDTFFAVGGLVTVYTFMKAMDKGVKFNIFSYYIHRYLRLTPIYVMIGLFHAYLLTYFGISPLWQTINTSLADTCKDNWWSSYLYITNYVQTGVCVPQTWYLAVDMQLFVLSPIVLLLLPKYTKYGLILLGAFICAGCVVPFVVGYTQIQEAMQSTDPNAYMYLYYAQTYTRFGPYVIGMLGGYYIYKVKNGTLKVILTPIMIVCSWLICLAGLVACVYGTYPVVENVDTTTIATAFYTGFNRNGWALFVLGVVFLCVAGYGGPIDKFLSLPIFQFLTKLSYSMYLVHLTVIYCRYLSLTASFKFTNYLMMHSFWGDFMLTLAISLVVSLAFESPIIILEKYIFGRNQPKKTREIKKPEV